MKMSKISLLTIFYKLVFCGVPREIPKTIQKLRNSENLSEFSSYRPTSEPTSTRYSSETTVSWREATGIKPAQFKSPTTVADHVHYTSPFGTPPCHAFIDGLCEKILCDDIWDATFTVFPQCPRNSQGTQINKATSSFTINPETPKITERKSAVGVYSKENNLEIIPPPEVSNDTAEPSPSSDTKARNATNVVSNSVISALANGVGQDFFQRFILIALISLHLF